MTPERWEPYRQRYPQAFAGLDTWHIHFGGHLGRSRGRTLLVDTGAVPTTWPLLNNPPGRLLEELSASEVQPEDVDLGVLYPPPPRPRWLELDFRGSAHISPRMLDSAPYRLGTFQNPEVQQTLPFPYVDKTVTPLEGLAVLDLLSGEHALTAEVTALPAPGHTPGHMALLISSGGAWALLLGDILVHPAQVTEPDLRFAFDFDQEVAVGTRTHLLQWIEAEGSKMA